MPLTQVQEDTEHEAKVAQMNADAVNKLADTLLKNEQRRWEPWKAMATAVGASAALFGVIGTVLGYLLAHSR